ncbi:glycosyltransferase family 2 protein [Brevundimonas variabilis]|uniref:Succinoglycan biosynthesis protein ExoA n=1 Tax=Brevundimonas variabilis TaxID=74312 RepID=A0A7W9FG78_9CAUL|nr:glycosyltransferase family 2 protein [Brevundimonas variabilis]MBB5746338.1 succinoglycan biosynthesis protein ExoA [Brevundimonas variabilis]
MSADGLLIVIPCLNEARHLPHLLEQLRSQNSPDDLIIVADGGSTDGSQDIVLKQGALARNIRLLHNPARLQSAGVNAAAHQYGSGRQYLIRIDAHARYPDDYAAGLAFIAQKHAADSVVVPMKTVAETCFQRAAATAQNSRIGTGGAAHRMGGQGGWVDHGHHALFRLDRFLALGGYNESFSHNEDAEFDLRLTKSGGRIWLEPELAIEYLPRRAIAPLFRQYVNYGRGRARTLALHRQRLRPRQALPLLVLPAVVAAVIGIPLATVLPVSALLAFPALAWATASIVGGVVASVTAGPSLCGLLSGFAAMAMHLGWSIGFWRERMSRRP